MNGEPPATPPSTPRWVKVFIALGIAIAVLIVLAVVLGGGNHGPGRHFGSHGGDNDATASATAGDCTIAPFGHGGGGGARATCRDAVGPTQLNETFACGDPTHGGLQLDWNADAGSFRVALLDDHGATVLDESYDGQGDASAGLPTGMTGTWTLIVAPAADFRGSLTVEVFCAAG